MKIGRLISLLSISLLSACGTDAPDKNIAEKADIIDKVETPKSTVLDVQLQALDKAKAVEESLQNNVDIRHQEMLKQGI